MNLLALSTRVPDTRLAQAEVHAALLDSPIHEALAPASRTLLRRLLLGNSGIASRNFARCDIAALTDLDGGGLNRAFEKEAVRLGSAVLHNAVTSSGVETREIDALLVCTCTGYICPGLSSHLAQGIGLRPDVQMVDLVGQGCGAAIPMLRQARALLADGCRSVACVAVEICSTAFFLSDDPAVLVSFCLFGDGAAAVILSREDAGGKPGFSPIARLNGFQSYHDPEQRETLRFVNDGGRLRNVLSPEVPAAAGRAVRQLYYDAGVLENTVLAHPGGRKVLDAVSEALGGPGLKESRSVLERHGNMSSPSILFVLEEWLRNGQGEEAWLTSFGAGFTCHACHACRATRG